MVDRSSTPPIAQAALPLDAILRHVAETTGDLVTVVDGRGRIRWASPSWKTTLGQAPEQLLGTDHFALVHPEDLPAAQGAFEAMRARGSARLALRLRLGDGSWRWFDLRGHLVSTEDAPVFLTVGRDVAQPAEEVLRASEERLRAIVEHSSNLFYAHTSENVLTYVSPQARRFLDCEPEEALVRWTEFISDNPVNAKGLGTTEQALRTGQRQPKYELELVSKSGRRVWVEVDEAPVLRDGKVTGMVGALTDITESKRARRMLQGILDGAPTVIFVKDLDGRYLLVNGQFEDLFGRRREQVLGRTDDALHPAELAALYRGHDAEVLRRRAPLIVEEEAQAHGERRTYLTAKFPLLDEGGQPYAVCGIGSDITEAKRAAQALGDANERLKAAEDARSRLVNMAAHELKTPLTPLKLQVTLLQAWAGGLEEKQRHALDVLDRNVGRLDGLVNDLLDATRLQDGRLKLEKQPLDLNQLLRETVDSFSAAAAGAGVQLEAALANTLPVEGDSRRLAQVMFNLLGNAVKFTPSEGRVDVEAAAQGHEAIVRVTDTGIGFSGDQAGGLFQPFSQLHHVREMPHAGSGLGLYIAKGIVEQHGGRIWGESAGPGKGATFSFALPLTSLAMPERTSTPAAPSVARDTALAERLRGGL